MLTSVGVVPLAGMCKIMMVSERAPVMSCPSVSVASVPRLSPVRLSEPVISQFVPDVGAGRPG